MANTRSGPAQQRSRLAAEQRRAAQRTAKPASTGRRRGAAPSRKPAAAAAPKPKPSTQKAGPAMPDRLKNAPPAPKLPAPTRTTVSRPTAARPAAKPKPKAPAKPKPPATSKPQVAQTSGIGPLKSGAEYASRKGSISESVRQLREMRAASSRRQTGQSAPALSGSKDYSSSFKDMKGGSSRFIDGLKKKKKLF